MITYKQLFEEVSDEKHHVLAFGRMNPITSGHEAVVNKLHSVAKEHGASHSLVVSHSQDAKKNPLTGEQKVAHAKNAFPKTNVSSASKEAPTILHHAAAAHKTGTTHLHVVAGSDRHEEMHNLLHKYNGQNAAHGHYNFKRITVHSSGERDPDAEGTTGISASKMREHAASGNKTEFHKGAPSKMKPEHKDAMYNDVRKGMNIKEETVQESLRPEMGAGAYVNDFISSTNPKFNNKSKEERRRMAIGAFMAAKARGVKEAVVNFPKTKDDHPREITGHDTEHAWAMKYVSKNKDDKISYQHNGVTIHHPDGKHTFVLGGHKPIFDRDSKGKLSFKNDLGSASRAFVMPTKSANKNNVVSLKKEEIINELSTDLLGKYKTAAHANAKASDAAGNYAKGDKRFKGINKATNKQFDNDLKKHGQMKEGTLQGNIGGGDAMNTTTSAPSASTSKDTTMSKKIKGFKFFNGENDKQMNMNQPVKEEKKDDVPFDGPYKSNFKKPNNPNRTGMDAARSLAQRAMDQLNKKKPVKEAKDPQEYGYEGDMALNQLATLTRCAEMIKDTLKPDTDLPEWVQSKITLATDYIQTAADYLYSESEVNEQHAPVAPVPDKKYIRGTPEHKAYKALRKPINGMPTNVKEENLDEKSDQAKQNKTMKNMMDASRGAKFKLNNPVPDTDHKTAREKNVAIGRALRNEATAQKGVNVDKVNAAGQEPHEEKFETAPKTVSKIKKVKEENMKSYKEFLQGLDEKLIGKQHKIDKNKNNKVDAEDFELLRKEEADHLLEYTPGPDGKTMIKGRSYGADYVDPEGADETAADMKKKEKKAAGRKAGQSTGSYKPRATGSYKPRATMSKLKSAGSTYK